MIRAVADTRIGRDAGVSGDGVLATISFRALGTGSSTLGLSRITLLNSQLDGIAFQSAATSLAIVPEPDTLVLVIVGILALRYRPGATDYSSRKLT